MRRLGVQLAALAVLATLGIAVAWLLIQRPGPTPDINALNDTVHAVQRAWPDIGPDDMPPEQPTVSVIDGSGKVVFASSPAAPRTSLDAVRARALSAPVTVNGRIVATLYLVDDLSAAEAAARRDAAWAATVVIAAVAIGTAIVVIGVHRRVVRPFEQLRGFATRVAAGDLDAPLAMDRANVFGAWTESFDLMRTELAASRRREQAAQQSKRDLVAQISHDVRTPVASIAATAELMRVAETDPTAIGRLGVIETKSTQIDALIADLFQANETELAALSVTPAEFASTEIAALITAADYERRTTLPSPVPDCIVRADKRRLAQVIDNVITNSYKYAGTPITVTSTIAEPMLVVRFTDGGPGVPDDELSAIFSRGVRGSNVGQTSGLGLGLFTCAHLMERMGGDIHAANTEDSFTITVSVPLA